MSNDRSKWHQRTNAGCVLLLCTVFASHALARDENRPGENSNIDQNLDVGDIFCAGIRDDKKVDWSSNLDIADKLLPNIPPEEEHYLVAETAALRASYRNEDKEKRPHDQTNYREGVLSLRPLYYVWKTRTSLKAARTALKRVSDSPFPRSDYANSPEAHKLQNSISALPVLGIFFNDLQDFLTRDELAQTPRLTPLQRANLSYLTIGLYYSLSEVMECSLARAMGLNRHPGYPNTK